MKAWSLIRSQPHYRHDAFISGLRVAGFEAHDSAPSGRIEHGDVLCIWNRYGHTEQIADAFERDGGTVLVAENGYVRGRHDGGDYYALAVHAHNGAGRWHVGDASRWDALGVSMHPWQDNAGGHILVAPNRSFGMRGMIMPKAWAEDTRTLYAACNGCEVRVRAHPGNAAPRVPLEHDLRGARLVVIWSSSVGVRALIEGVPVRCHAPHWICKDAARDLLHSERDERRLRALHALAWAQWRVDEIASGEAFDHVLRAA